MNEQNLENWDDVVEEKSLEDHAMEADNDPELELDPEDSVNVPEYYYTVQSDFTQEDGAVVSAGTEIPVKCKHCAVWETPLAARGGKPLCAPGVKTDVTIAGAQHRWHMNAERYSCQAHFVPKDIAEVLTHITLNPIDAQMLRWSFPVVKQLVKLQERIRSYYKKNGLEGAEKAVDNVIDFATLFTSQEQATYVQPYVTKTLEALKAINKKKTKRRGAQFRSGDEVEWDNSAGPGRVRGFISSIGGAARLMTFMVHDENVQLLDPGNTRKALMWKRPQAEWLKLNPELIGATPVVTVVADEED
jgi:hypothetical protein